MHGLSVALGGEGRAVQARKPLVGNKAREVENDPAGVEPPLQDVGKGMERGKVGMILGSDVKTKRACQFAVDMEPDKIRIVGRVTALRAMSRVVRGDCAVAQIGIVAQRKDRFAFLRGDGPAVFYSREQR